MLVAVNIPDLDVLVPNIFSSVSFLEVHRSLSHSIVFAPFFAWLIAYPFVLLAKRWKIDAPKRLLWLGAFSGVLLHIFIDLITSYGTQIFFPITNHRYSLDMMFIIDPWFTGILLLLLIGQKYWKHRSKQLTTSALIFSVGYLLLEATMHLTALQAFDNDLDAKHIARKEATVLPQPLSVFRWHGLAATDSGYDEAFFSFTGDTLLYNNLGNVPPPYSTWVFNNSTSKWYYGFSRFPLLQLSKDSVSSFDTVNLEVQDLQFNIDPRLLKQFGVTRKPSFAMKLKFSKDGKLIEQHL